MLCILFKLDLFEILALQQKVHRLQTYTLHLYYFYLKKIQIPHRFLIEL